MGKDRLASKYAGTDVIVSANTQLIVIMAGHKAGRKADATQENKQDGGQVGTQPGRHA